MDYKGLKTGGWVGQYEEKKEKMNGLVGAKNRGGSGQPKKKDKTNGLVGAKNRGLGRPT